MIMLYSEINDHSSMETRSEGFSAEQEAGLHDAWDAAMRYFETHFDEIAPDVAEDEVRRVLAELDAEKVALLSGIDHPEAVQDRIEEELRSRLLKVEELPEEESSDEDMKEAA